MPDCAARGQSLRAFAAPLLASVRYVSTVAPVVSRSLEHWRGRALAIVDPELRMVALQKLDAEGFNAEVGAMLATLAPAEFRAEVVEAIVALELLFDLLDGLSERPGSDPLGQGRRLFAPFLDALNPPASIGDSPRAVAGDYLGELSDAARLAMRRLPAIALVRESAIHSAERAAQAQIRMHAVPQLGAEQLRGWAKAEARGGALGWRELIVGSASSVLVVHALIVAAADARTGRAEAAQLSEAYLSVCVVLTLLDSLLDLEEDLREGRPGYLSVYDEPRLAVRALPALTRAAAAQTSELPEGAHHLAMLTGVVAYYLSAPGAAHKASIRPIAGALRRRLAPQIFPALAVMRAWRLFRRLRSGGVGA
jgi:tetraprenyl-beta-curcumene synthase